MLSSRAIAAALAFSAFAISAGDASACNRGRETCTFKLFNNTGHSLNSFWASPSRVDKWEEDILGRRTLRAGAEVNVNMTDKRPDCVYDFKFRFADGDELTRRRVNVCKLGRYTLNE